MPRLLSILAFVLLVLGGPASAGSAPGPFGGRAAEGESAAAPGFLASIATPVARTFLDLQRDWSRRISEQMRAARDGQTTSAVAIGALLAFLYGVLHAAGPGHGKLVVVTYFLGRDARIGRGLLMGGQIALMHVLSAVIIVGFADLLLRRTFGGVPSEIPAVRLVSYGLILAIGLVMLVRAVRHAADRHRDHGACGCGARHDESGLLSLGVGLVPCTGSVLILLYAFANGILWVGLVMVAAIALGMALTMGGLGLLSVLARRRLAPRLAAGGRALAVADVAGAGLIATLGAVLLATAV